MLGDCTIIGDPHVDRLAIVSRSTVAAPAFVGAGVTLIDSVVLGSVELRYVTLVGVRISGAGRIAGRYYESDETHLIIRADLGVDHAESVRIGPHVDCQGIAILGAGRVLGHLTIESIKDTGYVEALPEFWRVQPISVEQCAKDLEHALRGFTSDPFMGTANETIMHRPNRIHYPPLRLAPGEP